MTVVLPPSSPQARRLRRCAEAAFGRAMAAARAGRAVVEIGRAVEKEVRQQGFHVLRELAGHGVGRALHEPPTVPNYADPLSRGILTEGLVIAVEPMLSAERSPLVQEADGWTLRTRNRCLTAHYEHTVVITRGQPRILTLAA